MASTFLLIGGFIAVICPVSNLSLVAYQSFSIDKALIKKLYSQKKKKTHLKNKDFAEKDDNDDQLDEDQLKIKRSIS